MREGANTTVRTVERVGCSAGHDYWELGGWVDAVAEAGGDSSAAIFVPRVALVRSGVREVRLDAISGGVANVGISGVAESAEEENHAESEKLVQPEGFDVCIGGRIRTDSPVVVASGPAVR
jgi:hypothetical protein